MTTKNWFIEVANSTGLQEIFLVISYDHGFGDNDVFSTLSGAVAYFDCLPGGELWFFTNDSIGRRSFCLLLIKGVTSQVVSTLYANDYQYACRVLEQTPFQDKSFSRVLLVRSIHARDLLFHRVFYARGNSELALYKITSMARNILEDGYYLVVFGVHGDLYTRYSTAWGKSNMCGRIPRTFLCLSVLHFEGIGQASDIYWSV